MIKKEKLAIIRKVYPNAETTTDLVNKLVDFIENSLELDPGMVMFADSICCDDVNSIQYPDRMKDLLGPFKMGGLNGYPFAGLTGMGAFLSHVPDDGAVLIYYGPHIGITRSGELGTVRRVGISGATSCCGAAKAALKKLEQGKILDGEISALDYQMNTIEQLFLQNGKRILEAPSETRILEATAVMYEAIESRINELIELSDFCCKHLIVIGAIHINSDPEMGSFSSVRRFDVGKLGEPLHSVLAEMSLKS